MVKNELCGEQVSKMGIGIMRHDIDNFQLTQEIIDISMSHGINYFESCYFYLNNQCEKILSKALSKYNRSDYVLCGKMPVHGTLERETPEQVFEKQLKNCDTDYFDFYLLQALDRNSFDILEKTKAIDFLIEKKKQGIIKHLGFSFHDTPDVFKRYISLYKWDCVQLQLNYYDWYIGVAKQLYEICEQNNLPIIVMGGVKGGTLSDKLPEEAKRLLRRLNPNVPVVDYAYKFLTTLPQVKIVLSGANTISQIKENISFFSDKDKFGLYKHEIPYLKEVISIYKSKNLIDCTECGYCTNECPNNIKIKELFSLYNIILKDKSQEAFERYMDIQKSDYSSFKCVQCRKCERKCPQHLKITEIFHTKIFQLRL